MQRSPRGGQWWLVMALMLSIGVNLGIVATRLLPAKTPDTTEDARDVERADRPDTDPPDARDVDHPDVDRPDAPRREIPRMVFRMADELRLEGERRERFIDIQRRFFRQTMEARRQVQEHQQRLRRAMTTPQPDRAAIEEILGRLSVARGELERAFVENILDSHEVLGPQERRRFHHMLSRLRQARNDQEQRFRRPGGPRRSP